MEALFKKHFWVVKLLGFGAVVGFLASAIMTWAGANFLLAADDSSLDEDEAGETEGLEGEDEDEDEDDEDDPATRMKKANLARLGTGGGSKNVTAASIVERNIFCPTCAPPPPELAQTAGSGPVRPGVIKSSLPLALLVTMESDDPRYSMASILDTEKNALGAFSPDDTVRAGVTVSEIERGRVILKNGRQLEYIEIGGPPPPPPSKPTVKVKDEDEKKKNSREIDGAREAINCEGDSCTVDRAFVEQLLNNPAQLNKQARVVPAVRDGETRGFKFYGIRPGSLPKLLGLKNGDLVTSVNGHELKSLDGAMALYSKLRRANHLSVTLERKGKTVNKEIDIK